MTLELNVTDDDELFLKGPQTFYLRRRLSSRGWRWDPENRLWKIHRTPHRLAYVRKLIRENDFPVNDHLRKKRSKRKSTPRNKRKRPRESIQANNIDTSEIIDIDLTIEENSETSNLNHTDIIAERNIGAVDEDTTETSTSSETTLQSRTTRNRQHVAEEDDVFNDRRVTRSAAKKNNLSLLAGLDEEVSEIKTMVTNDVEEDNVELIGEEDIEQVIERKALEAERKGLIVNLL